MKEKNLVPQQRTGTKTGASAVRNLRSMDEARELYLESCARLLNVNRWYEYAGRKGTEFQLTDSSGNPIEKYEAQQGDLIRINIPAPPNKSGDSYDWVVIEAIERVGEDRYKKQSLGFRVRPVRNPKDNKSESAHFYTSEATSSFMIYRSGRTVYAMEKGRNEKPNLKGSFRTKIRNFFVALGAMMGLSVPMWKLWAESMLEPER